MSALRVRRILLGASFTMVIGSSDVTAQESALRIGSVTLRSNRGAPGLPAGDVGTVTVYVINQGGVPIQGLEAEFTTSSGVRLLAPSSIGTTFVDRQKVAVPAIAVGDSVPVVARLMAPRRAQPDGSLPTWITVRAAGMTLVPPVDLRLANHGIRSAESGPVVAAGGTGTAPRAAVTRSLFGALGGAVAASAQAPAPQVAAAPAAAVPPVRTFVSDVDRGIPRARQPRPDDIAVIIGNRTYRRAPEVTYAVNDARSMRDYAEFALGFRPGNIVLVEDATLSDLKVLFGDVGAPNGRIADMVKPGRSEVWVFYSGHGAPDPTQRRAYLMPTDADANRLALTGLSIDMLYENLSSIGAKYVTVVIDACFSGASGGGQMLITAASPIGIQVNDPAAQFADRGGATIIAAAQGQQLANWHQEQGHGMLTYFFLKGLQGSADLNKDGAVSVGEMRAWLTDRADGVPYESRRQHGRDQLPQVWGADERLIRP